LDREGFQSALERLHRAAFPTQRRSTAARLLESTDPREDTIAPRPSRHGWRTMLGTLRSKLGLDESEPPVYKRHGRWDGLARLPVRLTSSSRKYRLLSKPPAVGDGGSADRHDPSNIGSRFLRRGYPVVDMLDFLAQMFCRSLKRWPKTDYVSVGRTPTN
jgi:hypothetical protein